MQYVAFLRGMNVGGHRITNDDLCACFAGMGLEDPWAFLASGNVVFGAASSSRAKLAKLVESGLRDALGYDVPTFLRTAPELAAIAECAPFAEAVGVVGGKLQVAMLAKRPSAAQCKRALSVATAQDQLAIVGQELYWLPEGKLTESALDVKAIDKALGSMTTRTQRTLQRLSKKLLEQ